MSLKSLAGVTLLATLFAGPALADCTTDVKKADLTHEQANALYDCIKDKLREDYASADGQYTKEYQDWKPVATGPGAPGMHGKRFLMTFVNDTGYEEYIKYSDERGPMPVGSILAKESFNVNKKGEVKPGPLFFMEKVAAGGEADEYGNWAYTAFSPKGKAMKIKQSFCHGCHGAFDTQDAMGYPLEDLRLAAN